MPWRKGNRLPVVTEAQASGRTLEIYNEIKAALGLRYVNVVFQVYGGFPVFLDLHWRMLKPVVETRAFFEIGERLRADAYTRMHNYFEIPDLCAQIVDMHFSEGARAELTEVVDLLLYNNPLLLLMVAAQMQAFEGALGAPNVPREPASPLKFETRPILIDEDTASPTVKKIYEDMKRVFSMPVVHSDYRALARWPDFLQAYWAVLKPTTESPLYHQCLNGIRESAWVLSRELPGPFEQTVSSLEDAGMDEADIASVVRLTMLFSNTLSGTVLNNCLAKIGLEGGNMAHRAKRREETKQTPGTPEPVSATKEPTRAA